MSDPANHVCSAGFETLSHLNIAARSLWSTEGLEEEELGFLTLFLRLSASLMTPPFVASVTQRNQLQTGEAASSGALTFPVQALLLVQNDQLAVLVRLLQDVLALLDVAVVVLQAQQGGDEGHVGLSEEGQHQRFIFVIIGAEILLQHSSLVKKHNLKNDSFLHKSFPFKANGFPKCLLFIPLTAKL